MLPIELGHIRRTEIEELRKRGSAMPNGSSAACLLLKKKG